jgi:hypothetical protein
MHVYPVQTHTSAGESGKHSKLPNCPLLIVHEPTVIQSPRTAIIVLASVVVVVNVVLLVVIVVALELYPRRYRIVSTPCSSHLCNDTLVCFPLNDPQSSQTA